MELGDAVAGAGYAADTRGRNRIAAVKMDTRKRELGCQSEMIMYTQPVMIICGDRMNQLANFSRRSIRFAYMHIINIAFKQRRDLFGLSVKKHWLRNGYDQKFPISLHKRPK